MTLEELIEECKSIGGKLHADALAPCTEAAARGHSCIMHERDRALTHEEKQLCFTRRPFDCYKPVNLCAGCRAYWFAEMLWMTLEKVKMLKDAAG